MLSNASLSLRPFLVALALALALSCSIQAEATVSINQASQSELQTIKGIGPSLAKRILNERAKNGPFSSSSDLVKRVPGVGPKKLKAFQEAGLQIEAVKIPEPRRPSGTNKSAVANKSQAVSP